MLEASRCVWINAAKTEPASEKAIDTAGCAVYDITKGESGVVEKNSHT